MRRRFSELPQYQIDPGAAGLLPLELCLERLVVVLGAVPEGPDAPVTVGMLQPGDRELRAELEQLLDRPFEAVQLNAYEVHKALARQHGLPVGQRGIAAKLSASRELRFEAGLTPSQLVDDLLSVAVRQGATDVHLEAFQDDVDVRLRVDGFLRQQTTPLSPANVNPVVARLKVLASLDPFERRRPQDGHFSALYDDDRATRRVDLRVSVVPGIHGEDAVIRVLDPLHFRLDLERLGMPADTLARYRAVIQSPSGMLLIAGPTVSGKTNTLYATVQALRDAGSKVMTVEDPIEYEFPKINQKAVDADMGFADYLRAFLRQNPDVLMVGEIRDEETAEAATQAATTGHLVLSTVHTRSAVSSIGRLRVLGIPNETIAEVLLAAVGQRLVARNCPDCRRPVTPDPALVARYYAETPAHAFLAGAGCEACDESGFRGLVGVFELLEMDRDLRRAVSAAAPLDTLFDLALQSAGYEPLMSGALGIVAAGDTTLPQVARRILPPYPGYLPGAARAEGP